MKKFLGRVRRGRDEIAAVGVQVSARSGPTQTPNDLPNYLGNVDKIGPGTVQGWATCRTEPKRRLIVRLYFDDRLVAEGLANEERNDVRDAGFGDGQYGFQLPVAKPALFCAKSLKLVVLDNDGEIVCQRRVLREPTTRQHPTLYMDASDLIDFLSSYRELSGIQRVQAGYLLGLGDSMISGTQCHICTRLRSEAFYFDVPYTLFAQLLREAGDLSLVAKSAWVNHVRDVKNSLTKRADLQRGDTIFTMGAPWALDDHNEIIRCVKRFYGVHYLQVFYDLIPISTPEVVAAPLIPAFARAMAAMSTYADHIYAISRYSQVDLADTLSRLGRQAPGTSVIPMGGTITYAEDDAPDALDKLGVERPFVLCVGTLEPRKNHALLFKVWRRLVAKHGADAVPKLVLVGRVGWYMEDFMRQLKVTGYVEKRVVHLEGVTNAKLSQLYDSCLFTVFPSFSEGWGLPITESLSRGKVCVCSDTTSMPEAGGDYALYIDPYDTSAAHNLIERLIYDGEALAQEQAKLATFRPLTWNEASVGLRAQLADLIPHLATLPAVPPSKPVELRRTYKFFNIAAASPDATSTEVFRNFLDQEEALDLLVGWHWFELDVDCTWASGPEAELHMTLPEGSVAGFIAYLGLVIPPAYDRVPCEVLLDGVVCGRFKAAGACSVSIAIPGSTVSRATLTLRMKDERLLSIDRRLLGLGIATISVFAADDYEGRINYFEKRVIIALAGDTGENMQG